MTGDPKIPPLLNSILSSGNINYSGADILARLDAAGYVIVPKEPTLRMHISGCNATSSVHCEVDAIYRAMLAASQQKGG